MSERLNHRFEADNSPEYKVEDHEKRLEKHHETAANKARHEHKDRLDKILKTIEQEAKQSKDIKVEKNFETDNTSADSWTNSNISQRALKQNLLKIQKNLPAQDKPFSKFVHQPIVEAISEAASKTIARPSGLLFGGATALAANIIVLAVCKYYGYEYNYLVGILSFGIGFVGGLLLELAYKVLLRR